MILDKIGKTTTDKMLREIEKSSRTSILHSSSASLRLATELAYLNRIQGIRGEKEFYITLYHYMTSSQINDTFLFHRVIKILTGGRILQISIARCQIEAEIHSFPTMYGKGGGRCGKNWRNQGFRPKVMPKTRLFGGHKSGSSHFRVAWDPLFQR